jgi:polar amino acid transport system substrate-binding protein
MWVRILVGLFSLFSTALLVRALPGRMGNLRSRIDTLRNRLRLGQPDEAQARLVQTLDEFNKLYHLAPCGYHSLDKDGRVIAMNATELIWLGYPPEEAIDKLRFSEIVTADSAKRFRQAEKELARKGSIKELELEMVRKDGSTFPVLLNATAIKDALGFYQSCRCTIFDITMRKQAEEAATKARDQAIEASKFKSEFLANMSHEIRTPMNGILGMTEMLLRSELNERQARFATTINEAARSLLAVINDILDFSKIEAGKLLVEITEFEPVKMVESVAELLSGQAKKKKLSLLTFVDPKIPALMRGDSGRLRQILMNFAGNAIKFSESGEVLIRATIESENEHSLMVKFSVEDTGIGLTEDELSKLFQPFVQVDGSITRKHGGTGLGLSISKHLVELLGGEIGVNSVKGKGSTFWFKIPLERAPDVLPAARVAKDMKKLRVIVVDDEESSRDILHRYILSWGMRNGRARNAEEALEILRGALNDDDPYSIALIDLFMTGVNGLQLGQIIREDDKLKDMKLILITAFDNPGAGEEAIMQGFDAYLTKPIKQSQLLDCITTVVRDADHHYVSPSASKSEAGARLEAAAKAAPRDELILVVEDHSINQEVALLLLEDLGFSAHVANNGRHALDMLQGTKYSLIFMDCQMPELDGFGATNAIRKSETRTGKRVPIVAMTAHALEGSREQCLAAGMDDYLSKPIDPELLEAMIEKWLPSQAVSRSSKTGATGAVESSATPPIDLEALANRYGKNRMGRILEPFRTKDAPKLIAGIKQHLQDENLAGVLSEAHGLKGSSGTAFAVAIRQICLSIEEAGREKDWKTISELVDRLQKEFARLEAFLDAQPKQE